MDRTIEVYRWLLLARILMSWLPNLDHSQPVIVFLYRITEPVLRPFRSLLPSASGVDFSPIIVFILLQFVRRLMISALAGLLL